MNIRSRPSPGASSTAALVPDLLRSGSVLIYCRSSFILSALVFAGLLAKVYSDLYVHLIRRTARTLAGASAPPDAFFALLLAGSILLALRAKPKLEKTALLFLAANLGIFLLRRKATVSSDAYRALCAASLLLDLGLLAALVAFYRRYPNLLKVLRSPDAPEADGRIPPPGRMD